MNVAFARKVEASAHVAVGRLDPARVSVVGISARLSWPDSLRWFKFIRHETIKHQEGYIQTTNLGSNLEQSSRSKSFSMTRWKSIRILRSSGVKIPWPMSSFSSLLMPYSRGMTKSARAWAHEKCNNLFFSRLDGWLVGWFVGTTMVVLALNLNRYYLIIVLLLKSFIEADCYCNLMLTFPCFTFLFAELHLYISDYILLPKSAQPSSLCTYVSPWNKWKTLELSWIPDNADCVGSRTEGKMWIIRVHHSGVLSHT